MKPIYVAHITIEAKTPLKVGSANSDFLQDSPVQKDWNNLPMILGSSIAGVIRKDFGEKEDELFGKEFGSKIIFSNALLVDENGEVKEELLTKKSEFLSKFDTLPIREHTAITDKGVAKEHSKFDEEVVYSGSRFRFSIEVIEDKDGFDRVIELLKSNSFRIGGGTTKGFGKFKVLQIQTDTIDSIDKLINYSSSLNHFEFKEENIQNSNSETHINYTLKITPENFFMFGSGFGDDEADMTPVFEEVVDYAKKDLSKKHILLPASSIKGALSHRTAFYYNKNKKNESYTIESGNGKVGEDNPAVKAIFGHKKEMDKQTKKELGQKGKILISDCYKIADKQNQTKVFDHVKIDRFTGGAIDGALFQEKTVFDDREYEIEILIDKSLKDSEELKSFENALKDLCNGMLPLGGATTKGHGFFNGDVYRDGEKI